MDLKTIKFKRAFLETLTANEMKATRGGYGYGDRDNFCHGTFFCETKDRELIFGANCCVDYQCEKYYGSGSTCVFWSW
jgi:hypothetical protein